MIFSSLINTDKQSYQPAVSEEDVIYNKFSDIKENINTAGYAELCIFVSNNISRILSYAVNRKVKALRIITDKDFLIALDMCNVSFSREYINKFNLIYRAYIIDPVKNVIYNQTSANLLYTIALKINKKMVNILISIGLKEADALWIIVNRYSSTDERRNIRKVVRSIQHMSPYIMTEQMVVDIFAKLFSDQFTNLFIATMTDRFDSFDDDNEKYVYSTVSNALLDILNTMDRHDIKSIIIDYENELRRSGVPGRFSLNSINSADYDAICNIIDELEFEGYDID